MLIIYSYQLLIKLTKKIFICATEQSGDNIGFNIIKNLLKSNKDIIFDGVGGSKMSPFLNKQFLTLNDFNKIGIVEIIFSIRKYIKMIKYLLTKILSNNYDLIITIDSPDFNYPLIKKLNKNKYHLKQKKIHIVAPSVWAWRSYRAKKFSKVFDELLVLFEFEIDYFKKYNLKTTLIGHPVYYIENREPNIKDNHNIVFLPGSRKNELHKLLPYFKIAYNYLKINNPNLDIFIPTLPHLEATIKEYVKNWKMNIILSTDINKNEIYYQNSVKALVCSGTASLEIAKRNIPQLVIYKFNILTILLAKLFIKVKFANILNIITGREIIPELTNLKLNKYSFIKKFRKLMNNESDNINQIKLINESLNQIKSNLPPYEVAAKRINSYLY